MRISSLFRPLAAAMLGISLAGTAVPGRVMAQAENPPQGVFGPRVRLGQAQPQQQAAPAAETIATHGSWRIQCETQPKAASGDARTAGQRQCGMVQGAHSEKNPKVQLTLIIVKTKQGDKPVTMMRVMAPIGVFLPTGVALEIDGNAVGRVPFTRCLPQTCMAFAEASADTLTKMKKGNAANFIIYEAPGLGLPMKFNLDGFTAALAALESL